MTTMIKTLLILLPMILSVVITEDPVGDKEQCSVLKFQNIKGSYLRTSPDFSSATKVMSFCMWYKKMRSGWYNGILNYQISSSENYEILMSDCGRNWIYFMGQHTTSNKPTVPLNKWTHYCYTWSRASRVKTFYLNGEVTSTGESVDRDFSATGTLYIGTYGTGNYQFGGKKGF